MNPTAESILKTIGAREAGTDDCYEMWLWWNDPLTRQMMKLNEYVPWETHRGWFAKTLENPNRILNLITCEFGKIGVVRHDRKSEQVWETSIHFNPLFRGLGLGGKALILGRSKLQQRCQFETQFATLKNINVASRRSFEKAGYIFSDPPDCFPGLERFDAESELFCLWNSKTSR
ncbi:GNAT family N-acetyltransferase [Nibricoccus sp. IMCC34717]|uniref:GNAT family N-acetyltransferase n=1 Tax=Nibricoccus sp. IMCC34717 TaxID=3034021 RepID=UPI00384E20B2